MHANIESENEKVSSLSVMQVYMYMHARVRGVHVLAYVWIGLDMSARLCTRHVQ